MNKIIPFVLVACFSLVFASPALAAETSINSAFPEVVYDDSGADTYIGALDAASLSVERLAFYREAMSAFVAGVTQQDTSKQYLLMASEQQSNVLISFIALPASVPVNIKVDDNNSVYLYAPIGTERAVSHFRYAPNLADSHGGAKFVPHTFGTGAMTTDRVMTFKNARYTILCTSSNINYGSTCSQEPFLSNLSMQAKGNTYIVDNLDNPMPDNPSGGDDIGGGDYNPTPPNIPEGDSKYVPYKTSIWESFLSHIKKSIGAATNIGFLIFAVIFAIYLIVRIIKWFSRT